LEKIIKFTITYKYIVIEFQMDFEELSNLGIHKQDSRFINNIENNAFINKYNKGLLEVTNFQDLKVIIKEIYNLVKSNNQGELAD